MVEHDVVVGLVAERGGFERGMQMFADQIFVELDQVEVGFGSRPVYGLFFEAFEHASVVNASQVLYVPLLAVAFGYEEFGLS